MAEKLTAPRIRAMRTQGKPIVCVTAYDATFGAIADESGADLILVGDSLGNVLYGYDSTISVSLEQMIWHTRATRAGVKRALLVADLPFGSYQSSTAQAVESSVALMKAGAEAVKLEGVYTEAIEAILRAGIPVMGHVGMTPQSVHRFGGFRVQGKGDHGADILKDAQDVDQAGVFATVLELIPAALAATITAEVSNPTIGIGAGEGCNGQIQVLHDVLGLGTATMRHAKAFVGGRTLMVDALKAYGEGVRAHQFPTPEQSF
ncbi:MAG: 3-methyl-2-oxobutanoate hydroxymethyltransferase [Fimbriimonas sp.]